MAGAGSHYAALGLEAGASLDDIKKAHRRLALKWHPDKVADPNDEVAVQVATQQFQLVQVAYEVLSDPEKRRRYDERRPGPGRAAAAQRTAEGASPWKRPRPAEPTRPSPAPSPAGWQHGERAFLRVPADAANIARAVDMLPVSGGTISVEPGAYTGIAVVSKPFVEIVGAAAVPGRTVLQGQVVFRECALGARLRGLRIVASCTGGAVDLKGVRGNVSIEDCDISNELSAGVIFEGCTGDFRMSHCVIQRCKYDGLGLHPPKVASTHSGSVTIMDSRFEGNGYDGLYLGDPRFKVRLVRSHVVGNARHGIFVRGTALELEETAPAGNGIHAVHREAVGPAKPAAAAGCAAQEPKARELDSTGLPEGWRAFRTAEGLTYYYESRTGTTQWSHPAAAAEGEGGLVQHGSLGSL